MAKHTCVNDCGPARRKSKMGPGYWCDACDKQFRLYGDPMAKRRRRNGELRDLLQEGVDAEPGDCVIFDGQARRYTTWFNGRTMHAARAVWVMVNGDPGPLHVLHSCNGGNGENGCINIHHLYLGDNWRNRWDMVNAGRTTSPLTEADVVAIRAAYVKGARFPHPGSSLALALQYGVCRTTIGDVCRKSRRWIHVK